jgi:uncharacterized membrane protein YqjE
MEDSQVGFGQLAGISRQLARRLCSIGENRLELLTVEVQEEREHLLHAFLLVLGAAVFALLASLALTAAIVVGLWTWSPVAVLLILASAYGTAGGWLYRRLTAMIASWQTLPATIDQLRKDRTCLEKTLA